MRQRINATLKTKVVTDRRFDANVAGVNELRCGSHLRARLDAGHALRRSYLRGMSADMPCQGAIHAQERSTSWRHASTGRRTPERPWSLAFTRAS